jgi:hypothetical protein
MTISGVNTILHIKEIHTWVRKVSKAKGKEIDYSINWGRATQNDLRS